MQLELDNEKMHAAAKYYLIWLCEACNTPYGIVPESEPYDLLVDFGEGWKKVQIKSSWHIAPSGFARFSLVRTRSNAQRTVSRRYTADEVDLFFLYTYGKSWMIPCHELRNYSKTVTPEVKFSQFLVSYVRVAERQTRRA